MIKYICAHNWIFIPYLFVSVICGGVLGALAGLFLFLHIFVPVADRMMR